MKTNILWMTPDKIIKQTGNRTAKVFEKRGNERLPIVKNVIQGYDILTESFSEVFEEHAMRLPNSVIKLIGNRNARYSIVETLAESNIEAAIMMGVTERTFYRYKNQKAEV